MSKSISLNALSLSGLAATFVGNGIGRFAYIALFPVIIQQAWFSYAQASSLGAATLLGYLLGVPMNHYFNKKISSGTLLRVAMLICSLSYLACALKPAGFYWFLFWRTTAGIAGAMLMVLAPSLVLRQCPVHKRKRFSGIVFTGVGLGVMASGTLIPWLVRFGISETFLFLGLLCLLLTFLTWEQWQLPNDRHPKHTARHPERSRGTCALSMAARRRKVQRSLDFARDDVLCARDDALRARTDVAVFLLLIAYALNAVGYLPHTLFWVEYITHFLKMPISTGGFFWAVFGVGALIGPMITGELSRYFGLTKTLVLSFFLKAVGVALPLFSSSMLSLFSSSLLVGIFTPGVVNIVSNYALELVGVDRHQQAWGWMTFSFAFAQAVVSFLMIYIMTNQKSYQILFATSAISLLISCLCVLVLHLLVKATSIPSSPALLPRGEKGEIREKLEQGYPQRMIQSVPQSFQK